MTGQGGLLTDPERAPRMIADTSTALAEASETIRVAALERGTQRHATPVSGNPAVIAAGELTVAVSGPRAAIASATRQIVAQAAGAGHAEEDFATLILEVGRGAGMTLESETADVADGLEPER